MPIEIRHQHYRLPPPRIVASSAGVRAGDEDPPDRDDLFHSPADRLEYATWIDHRVSELEKAFDSWQGGGGKPPPENYAIANKAGEWAASGFEGKPWLQWVAEVWRPLFRDMRLSYWTLLNTHWPELQTHHRTLKEAELRARAAKLPDVPPMGNPEVKSPIEQLEKPAAMTADLLKAGGIVLLGVAGILLVREMKT